MDGGDGGATTKKSELNQSILLMILEFFGWETGGLGSGLQAGANGTGVVDRGGRKWWRGGGFWFGEQ
ncbi:hypothetical protein Prudu_017985 [Prunus dulcis]|uniref:Uncharacterized protein n=1 Tax=Prunus dulcis TaxID=3755 RepID=A0A4Y1RQ12_PRUDU|nr:hypothetical protein Prudu_017985 [Prunus dulcis]